jgi:hypothetical protein
MPTARAARKLREKLSPGLPAVAVRVIVDYGAWVQLLLKYP